MHQHENDLSGQPDRLSPDELAEIERELSEFSRAEADALGLGRAQWRDRVNTTFTASQRGTTTIWVSGLTIAHDELVVQALKGLGYQVAMLESPDNTALQLGKEFGNRGQCNPTYFTVGNLVKHVVHLRDVVGMPTAEIIERHVFLTAGACGPCRFGTYVTEYRKALRDAGFDGFRVLLFQQQGGVKQATGDEIGLKIDVNFAIGVVRALIAGDVLNLIGYRIRPYEVTPGATNAALEECKRLVGEALAKKGSLLPALMRSRLILSKVEVDRTQPKPVVSVIGEFWAMTTEGEGNYRLQKFLEREGAEVDIQGVTNWILFMIWENRYDTKRRMDLREQDGGRKGLEGKDPTKKLWGLAAAEPLVRGIFQLYAKAVGLHGYHLPNMDEIAALAKDHYSNDVRGGEGHMEVGKLIHFAQDKVNHMTVSVKPFGCMPSSGVSDGVQTLVAARYPDSLFLPIETTGDGEVNVHSRVQMMLFKAHQKARAEFEEALSQVGLDETTFKARVRGSRRWRSAFSRPAHRSPSVVTSLVYAVG
ncbi:MAG: 2-hydroxyglutaryl-CoA dehydratase [Deltaproteobacteria bacterium]|nr:2-hydroxyglutaryl-CoA dehydratase [Deltaproteobacteria bacterium]